MYDHDLSGIGLYLVYKAVSTPRLPFPSFSHTVNDVNNGDVTVLQTFLTSYRFT
jgi:hypothetical protein